MTEKLGITEKEPAFGQKTLDWSGHNWLCYVNGTKKTTFYISVLWFSVFIITHTDRVSQCG